MIVPLAARSCESDCDRCAARARFMADAIVIGAAPRILRTLSQTLDDAVHGRPVNSSWAVVDAMVERILCDADVRPAGIGAAYRLRTFLAENRPPDSRAPALVLLLLQGALASADSSV